MKRREIVVKVTVTRRYRIVANEDTVNGRTSLHVLSDQIKYLESHPNPVSLSSSFTGFTTTEAVELPRTTVEVESK